MSFIKRPQSSIKVGDLVYCANDSEIPADLMLIYTSGNCSAFMDTTNLDGEMIVKEKFPLQEDYGHTKI